MKTKFIFIILCFIFIYAHADNQTNTNNNNTKNTITKKPKSLGTCEYLDYYIYNCLTFTCTVPIEFMGGDFAATFKIYGKNQNICSFDYKFNSKMPDGQSFPIKIHCNLDSNGIYSFRKSWFEYTSGTGPGFTKSSQDPLLKKGCQPSLAYD